MIPIDNFAKQGVFVQQVWLMRRLSASYVSGGGRGGLDTASFNHLL